MGPNGPPLKKVSGYGPGTKHGLRLIHRSQISAFHKLRKWNLNQIIDRSIALKLSKDSKISELMMRFGTVARKKAP